MNDPRNIVIVGGENGKQGKLETNLEPVKLSQRMEIAVTSIFHGEVFNISEKNNQVDFYVQTQNIDRAETQRVDASLRIPPGHYPTRFSILKAISDQFTMLPWPEKDDDTGYYTDTTSGTIHFLEPKPIFGVKWIEGDVMNLNIENMEINFDSYETPWDILGIRGHLDLTVSIKNVDFRSNLYPAFVYVNIVESSFINGKLSRLLTMVPISMNDNWSYHEFSHPNYVPLEVREFSKIHINILDMNGHVIKFNPEYKTVISLHTKYINRLLD